MRIIQLLQLMQTNSDVADAGGYFVSTGGTKFKLSHASVI